ncbi:MAG TPA: YCF48-related protein [Kofleriaceae bacterium]
MSLRTWWLVLLLGCDPTSVNHEPDAAPTDSACAVATGTLRDQVLANGDGVEDRYYWLHVPSSYDCTTALPLLVDFHGTASDKPEEAYQTDALIAFAERENVIVARPRSRSAAFLGFQIYRWDQNAGDLARNRTFAKLVVDELELRYAIDPARVYASGFSSGSNMTAQFLVDATSPFRGLAPIAGGRWTQEPLPALANGPRVYMSTGYRDYLWPTARTLIAQLATAGLPDDRLYVSRTGGGHDLYAWHFDEAWRFLDRGERPGAGAIAAPWTATTLPSPADVNAFALDGSTLVAAGARGRTWRRDSTSAWSLELDRGNADYTALCFGPSDRSFVGGSYTGVLRTSGTWGGDVTLPDYGMLGRGWVNGAACRDDGSIVVVGYWSAALTSNGTSWSQFHMPSTFGVEHQSAGVAQAPSGATVAVGYYDFIGVAAQGSVTTTDVAHGAPTEWWNAVAALAGGRFWVVGDAGQIRVSTNGGASWQSQASGTSENLYAVHFADAMHGAAVGRRGTVIVTADGGAHWTARPLGKDVYLGAVFVDATTVTIAGEAGLVATSPR